MKLSGFTAAAVFTAAAARITAAPLPERVSAIRWESCPAGALLPRAARCGRLSVFEDRKAGSGRKIDLFLIVSPAISRKAATDPLFFLAGGPGQGAATLATGGGDFLDAIRLDRDIVFVDQRGTGRSHPLDCDLLDRGDLREFFRELFPVGRIRACRLALDRDADLRQYTTEAAIDDLDDVREVLGYRLVNIEGGSYGTLAAQVYLRRHPDHVRSLILEAVATPDFRMPLPVAQAGESALQNVFSRCRAEPGCNGAFPNLPAEFSAVLSGLSRAPAELEVKNPWSRKPETVLLTRGVFAERLRLMLYGGESLRLVPLLLHEAARGNYIPFSLAALHQAARPGPAFGLSLSVTCSESIPFIGEEEIRRETAGTFLSDYRVREQQKACGEWPRAAVRDSFLEKVRSNRPVLMISGSDDPATPARFGRSALSGFPAGRQVVIPEAGHVLGSECATRLIVDFLRRGSVTGLDVSCVDSLRPAPFLLEMPKDLRN